MSAASNNAEGGTNGTTVTTANSGGTSGDGWDTVTITASTTLTFSSAQSAHGSLSYLMTTPASAITSFVQWTSTTLGSAQTKWSRIYGYFDTTVVAASRIMQFTDTSGTVVGGIGLNGTATRHFKISDATNTAILTGTAAVPVNQWFRLEFMCFSDASVGQMELKIFLTADSTTPDEVLTTTATQNTNGNVIQRAVFGLMTGIASATFYMDDLAVSDTGYLGPAVAQTNAPVSWIV
jgi:hypothetical protein